MKKSIRQLIRSLTLLAFIGLSSFLTAQNMLKGNVKDQDGNALIGVTVSEKGSTNGALTDVNGNYELSFTKSEITVLFRYIGFADVEKAASASTGALDVAMKESTTQLDQVVITGLGTSVKRSNLANSVDYIDSQQLTGITNQSTMEGALYGKFKGANITSNSGAPGGGMSIRLRGVTAVLGSKQPIYIIDGVLLDNSTTGFGNNAISAAAGGGNQASNQDDATNRIADIDPEDIESMEILKGSSAAAIYGAKAANGVVIITTKKGKNGKPVLGFSQTFGMTKATRLLGQRDWNRERAEATVPGGGDLFEQNENRDYEDEVYGGTGLLTNTRVSLSGKKDNTSYFIGGTVKREDGIVENTGYDKSSVRANISQKFSDLFSMDFTSNYISSETDKGFFNNSNNNTTVGYALAFTYPWENLSADENGIYPAGGAGSNVLETTDRVINRENVNRFIGGLKLNFNLLKRENQLLKLSVFGGYDNYSLSTTSIFPRSLSYFRTGQGLEGVNGATVGSSGSNLNQNSNAILVHTYYTPSNTTFRTQVGLTQESTDYDVQRVVATNINGSETSLAQAGNRLVEHKRNQFIDQGFFIQEEVNFKDKIIGTLGVRADKSTRNGDVDKIYYYPKANIAFNVHELTSIGGEGSTINSLKLRVAYGEAGLFPSANNKITPFNATNIDGSSAVIPGNTLGDPTIGPQRNKELEFGTDVGLMDGKVFLDVTYYTRKSVDFLLNADLPLSSGYTGEFVNAGDLVNQGLEIGLSIKAMEKENFTWNTNINWWKNTSEVTRLDVDQTTTGGFANSLGTYLIQEGESITQIVGSYVADDCDGCDPDGDGLIVYGNAEPDFNMSWLNSVNIGKFDINMLWHWKKGGDGINLSTLLYDLAGTTWDYDDTDLDPDGELTNSDYRVNNFFAGSPVGFVESTSYLRLREVAVYYKFDMSDKKAFSSFKIGVSGQNVINIFDYNSYDPEVSNFGNDALGNSVEVTPFPSSKRYNFHIVANF